MKRLLAILAFLALALPAALALAAEPKGQVEAAAPGFFAQRDGSMTPLGVGDDIYEFDILETGPAGSALIRFLDGSTLELRSGSRLDVKEVVFSGDRNRFNVGLTHGAARIVTGAIVRANPRGFKITTPKTTIGIRGTTLVVEVAEKYERVSIEHLSEGSYVTCTDKANRKDYSLTAPSDSVTINSVERADPVTGAVGATTEVTTEGTGVTEGAPTRGTSTSGAQPGTSQSGGGGGGRETGGSASGGSGKSDAGCCSDTSSPGR
jgi:hypothetical protein